MKPLHSDYLSSLHRIDRLCLIYSFDDFLESKINYNLYTQLRDQFNLTQKTIIFSIIYNIKVLVVKW